MDCQEPPATCSISALDRRGFGCEVGIERWCVAPITTMMTIVTPQNAFFPTSARIVFISSWSVFINSTDDLLSVFSSRGFPDRRAASGEG